MKKVFKSKTIWFAMILAALSVLQGFILDIPLPPKYQAAIGVVVSLIVTVLRAVTTGSLDDK